MAINIKKARPLFTGVITTANTYLTDEVTDAGLVLVNKRTGSLNNLQTVISVGSMVHDVKPGDIVSVNLNRYLKAEHLPGVIEDNIQKDSMRGTYEIPKIVLDGKDCLFLQNNDIEFVVEEFDGVDEGGLLE